MAFKKFTFFLLLIYLSASHGLQSQTLTREQVSDTINDMPLFSMYEHNYFISGVPLKREINQQTADAKYQISFKLLLSRNQLPLNSYLFLTYTQKAFWNLYASSKPFEEIDFKPGLSMGIPIFHKQDRLLGMAFLKYEHESNGRDSIFSRSWNKLSLAFHADLADRYNLSAEVWYPFLYKDDNPQLLEYRGIGEVMFSYVIKPDRWFFETRLQKGLNWDWKGSIRTRILYSPFDIKRINLMLEWYYGYGESLITFEDQRNMLRLGFIFRSDDLNFL
ncbi:phospholipase A [Salinimicrobium xinjiangense]|uniref:phospholipase A n=1 Tax=Salinimicrobium xinjiangense TaxID=438596 RepID=UPI0003F88F62|nr:phospholipase A [Salinimicrobium xinjiangense]